MARRYLKVGDKVRGAGGYHRVVQVGRDHQPPPPPDEKYEDEDDDDYLNRLVMAGFVELSRSRR